MAWRVCIPVFYKQTVHPIPALLRRISQRRCLFPWFPNGYRIFQGQAREGKNYARQPRLKCALVRGLREDAFIARRSELEGGKRRIERAGFLRGHPPLSS